MTNIFAILSLVLTIYSYILIARALISWIPNLDPYNPIVQLLYQLTEPVLEPIRRLIPPIGGMLDISFIIAFFAIIMLQQLFASMVR